MPANLLLFFPLFENKGHTLLSDEEKRRRDRRIPQVALRFHNESPFFYLFKSGDEQALLNCCAVDHTVFRRLLEIFEPVFNAYTVDKYTCRIRKRIFTKAGVPKGRKRFVDGTCCLGLVLYWYRTRGSVARATALAFGLTATPMYKWLKFGRRVLLLVLRNHPLAMISTPTEDELQSYTDAIGSKYPVLRRHRVWGAADGLKLRLQQSSDWAIQNRFYNGWTGSTYVNSLFVFALDGRIQICTLNAPGTSYDSAMAAYGVYSKMEALYNQYKVKVVVDSAFRLADADYMIRSSQEDPTSIEGLVLNRAAISVRQLSEWGMRMIQGQFPRMKDSIVFEEAGERKVILNLMVLLYSFQTSAIGMNEILNSFMSRTAGFGSFQGNVYSNDRVHQINETANDVFAVATL